jgi:hypothetical protein
MGHVFDGRNVVFVFFCKRINKLLGEADFVLDDLFAFFNLNLDVLKS